MENISISLQKGMRRVARASLTSDEFGSSCVYCSFSQCNYYDPLEDTEPVHDHDCPVNVFREYFRLIGIPVTLYAVRYEVYNSHSKTLDVRREGVYEFTPLDAEDILRAKIKAIYPQGSTVHILSIDVVRTV